MSYNADIASKTPITISDGVFKLLSISSDNDLGAVKFKECYFGVVDVSISRSRKSGTIFEDCTIENLRGTASEAEFTNSYTFSGDIQKISDEAETNTEIIKLDVSLGVKVLLTILRKLFVQKGNGRQESALYRGIDQRAQSKVSSILDILQANDIAKPYRRAGPNIWIPNRSKTKIVGSILFNPHRSNHQFVKLSSLL